MPTLRWIGKSRVRGRVSEGVRLARRGFWLYA